MRSLAYPDDSPCGGPASRSEHARRRSARCVGALINGTYGAHAARHSGRHHDSCGYRQSSAGGSSVCVCDSSVFRTTREANCDVQSMNGAQVDRPLPAVVWQLPLASAGPRIRPPPPTCVRRKPQSCRHPYPSTAQAHIRAMPSRVCAVSFPLHRQPSVGAWPTS